MSAIFGETLSFKQESGPDVELVAFGDEFYARYETKDGFTAIYDGKLGLYCYAELADGKFISTAVPISEPAPDGLRRHLKEAPSVRNDKFDNRYEKMMPPKDSVWANEALETYGPNQGLLEGRQVNTGVVCGLTILVEFPDLPAQVTAEEVSALLNEDGYTANGNYCSVREYFRLMSSGLLDYSNVVIGPIRLSQEQRYYVDNLLAEEALNLVVDMGVDLSQFDSKGEGYIDALSFMYAGPTLYEGWLWPHNYYLEWEHGGYRAHLYMITSQGLSSSDLSIGTFCHESGHMLCRFPDLYDYGKRDGDFERSAGMGVYCLMSAGNHLNSGRTPAPVCGYLRYLAGWCSNEISLNTPGSYTAVHGDYGTVLVYNTVYENEYFLIENRSEVGLDQGLPSAGLAIYHCDIWGSNEWQGGSADSHYQCGLLQADGHFDLEHGLNVGDATDLFAIVEGEVLSDATTPSTRLWDGSDSGLRIADIGAPGEAIGFNVV
ncbi:MAG: M6 family metalloprotease domain-containing protein [Anaerolineae bacterium]|nr:M6 family metalloprotease domain-containing protein [Anaerolineae bacterium]